MKSALNFLLNIRKPEVFHGHNRKDKFFEGWYFKLVDKAGDNVISVIPGIYISRDPGEAHSFIQFLEGYTHKSYYFRYDTDDFLAAKRKFLVNLSKSEFASDHITLDINQNGESIKGHISFTGLKPWPVTIKSPGIMGWYSYVPFMECNHGVLSLSHRLKGKLEHNGKKIDFTGGRGYIEKDWGSNFPSSYIWIQCNHFSDETISFTGSVARIPWLRSWFRGYIFGLRYKGKLYRLTTYTGAKMNAVKVTGDSIFMDIFDKRHRITVNAHRTQTGVLFGPYESRMVQRVSESLNSQIKLEFYSIDNGKENLIFSGTGIHAGVEANGRLDEIADI